MKKEIVTFALLLLLAVGCGGPSSPSDPLNQFNWTVDGQSFRASSNGMFALDRGGGNLAVVGTVCSPHSSINLDFSPPVNVGTVPNDKVTAMIFNSFGQWQYSGQNPGAGGGGSVTLTSVSPRMVGSFSYQLVPLAGTGATGTKSVQGNFDLSFDDRRVCE